MDMKIGGTDSQTGGRGRGGGMRPNSGLRIGMDMKIGGTDSQTGEGGEGGET